jgi:SanA protein
MILRVPKILKWVLIPITSAFLAIAGLNVWVVMASRGYIFENLSDTPAQPVAIVLGTSPNQFLANRIKSAASLYKAGKVKKIIVSGDNGTLNYNEPVRMRKELVSLGVPTEDIVLDHAGFRTLDSVLRAKLVFGQSKMIVVSQKFHVQRAVFIARAHGLEAYGYVAPDPGSQSMMSNVLTREYFARVKAWLDCYILNTQPKFPGPAEPIQI